MSLSYKQRAALRDKGIVATIEYANGTAKCLTLDGIRIYTMADLAAIAKPGFFDRFTAWIGGRAA